MLAGALLLDLFAWDRDSVHLAKEIKTRRRNEGCPKCLVDCSAARLEHSVGDDKKSNFGISHMFFYHGIRSLCTVSSQCMDLRRGMVSTVTGDQRRWRTEMTKKKEAIGQSLLE